MHISPWFNETLICDQDHPSFTPAPALFQTRSPITQDTQGADGIGHREPGSPQSARLPSQLQSFPSSCGPGKRPADNQRLASQPQPATSQSCDFQPRFLGLKNGIMILPHTLGVSQDEPRSQMQKHLPHAAAINNHRRTDRIYSGEGCQYLSSSLCVCQTRTKHFSHFSHLSLSTTSTAGMLALPTLQMKKLRLRGD